MNINGFENLNAALFGWSDGDNVEEKETIAERKVNAAARQAAIAEEERRAKEAALPWNQLRQAAADCGQFTADEAVNLEKRTRFILWYIEQLRSARRPTLAALWFMADTLCSYGYFGNPHCDVLAPAIPWDMQRPIKSKRTAIMKILGKRYPEFGYMLFGSDYEAL